MQKYDEGLNTAQLEWKPCHPPSFLTPTLVNEVRMLVTHPYHATTTLCPIRVSSSAPETECYFNLLLFSSLFPLPYCKINYLRIEIPIRMNWDQEMGNMKSHCNNYKCQPK